MAEYSRPDEIVFYIAVRKDLQLSYGKLAAQAGHAVQLSMRAAEAAGEAARADLAEWEGGSYPKVCLSVKNEAALLRLAADLSAAGIPHAVVRDEGRTEVAAGTATVLGIGPVRRSRCAPHTKRLQLY